MQTFIHSKRLLRLQTVCKEICPLWGRGQVRKENRAEVKALDQVSL